jgi:hypothetical protein
MLNYKGTVEIKSKRLILRCFTVKEEYKGVKKDL